MLSARPGIIAATMLVDKAVITSCLGKLGGSQEQHVFKKMRHSGAGLGIIEVADINRHGCGGLGRMHILHQQHPQAVGQSQMTIAAVVIGAGNDRLACAQGITPV